MKQKKARPGDLAFETLSFKEKIADNRQAPLDRSDILGLGTFLALGNREFDLLSFGQSFEA